MKRFKGCIDSDVVGIIVLILIVLFMIGSLFIVFDSALGEKAIHNDFAVVTVSEKRTHSERRGKVSTTKHDIYYSAYLNRRTVSYYEWSHTNIGDEVTVQQVESWGKWTGHYYVGYYIQN